jgi:hypothetical protein
MRKYTNRITKGRHRTVEILQRLFNIIWGKDEIPHVWKEGVSNNKNTKKK